MSPNPRASPIYRRVWLYGWGSVSVILIGLACLMWGPAIVLIVGVVAGGCWGLVTTAFSATSALPTRGAGRRALGAGLVAGTGAVAVLALAAVNAALGAVALLLAAGTSPWVVARLRWAGRSDDEPSPGPAAERVAPGTPAGLVGELSDPELCRAWRASFGALLDSSDPEERDRVVRLRQQLLDELERRHPEEVRVWLASVPRAADGPERYLRQPRPGGRDAA